MRTAFLVVTLLLLSACQSTTFEKPPIAEAACDPGLAGHWSSIDDDAGDDGEIQLDIDASCGVDVSDRHQGGMRHGDATQMHVGRSGAHGYVWVDAAWADKRFEADLKAAPGDVFLMRYELKGEELLLNALDDKAIAHRILDDAIPGDTRKIGHDLQNRITGGPHPDLLVAPEFFSAQVIRFRRVKGPAKP